MLNPVEPLWSWLKWGRLSDFAPKDAVEIESRAVAESAVDPPLPGTRRPSARTP